MNGFIILQCYYNALLFVLSSPKSGKDGII